ncbi:hypothetical protein DFH06DRAFT_1340321 [Mycena polygramma]|nr:hypothetical protein DFH06DRAFT_1350287 [Mycena polygramma]KAJ7623000.1 hypothetical protein DFH06DRAFT_1340321 [Mycena polygramma]
MDSKAIKHLRRRQRRLTPPYGRFIKGLLFADECDDPVLIQIPFDVGTGGERSPYNLRVDEWLGVHRDAVVDQDALCVMISDVPDAVLPHPFMIFHAQDDVEACHTGTHNTAVKRHAGVHVYGNILVVAVVHRDRVKHLRPTDRAYVKDVISHAVTSGFM